MRFFIAGVISFSTFLTCRLHKINHYPILLIVRIVCVAANIHVVPKRLSIHQWTGEDVTWVIFVIHIYSSYSGGPTSPTTVLLAYHDRDLLHPSTQSPTFSLSTHRENPSSLSGSWSFTRYGIRWCRYVRVVSLSMRENDFKDNNETSCSIVTTMQGLAYWLS